MNRLRILVFARRWLAAALVVAVLAVRIVVPAGMMPGHGASGATLVVCSGWATSMPGMAMPAKGHRSDAPKPENPCAFTGLVAAALDAPPLPLLPARSVAATPAVPAVLGSIVTRPLRLWPPRRGPPARIAI